MITVAAINPSVDRLLRVLRLRPGTIHRPLEAVSVPGGKGLNVARVAHALGAEVQVVGIAAGGAGRWVADALERAGVPARWIWTDGETRTCTSIAEDDPDVELTEFYESGPTISAQAWHEYAALVGSAARRRGWLVVSGSFPPDLGASELSDLLRATTGRTAVDVSGEPLAAATGGMDLVKLNTAETVELLGRGAVRNDHDLPELARALRHRWGGSTVAVVTGGQRGAVLSTPEGPSVWARTPVTGRFAVGSGDAFLAGLLTARQSDSTWEDALRLATAAAAANAETPGAGVVAAQRVRELVPLVEMEEVRT
ncbi:PfkB family carbohydrate kinase [Nocardioides sp.]|uniref:1-phosphofructokinase family hexose kinase n=1 Tax=Nocardioides sp. TaxID=35761 RepID=UPI0026180D0D|nr:PfkB family carbohydrate kinase [Nocardioides sp.]MDI6910248.1 PfkB family carbohydrate kinase [Nocardioides sp.]